MARPSSSKKPLLPQEKTTLIIALNEMKARGMPIPEDALKKLTQKTAAWPVDRNGYFIKRDGTSYNPTPQQKAFIESPQRFVIFPRGS